MTYQSCTDTDSEEELHRSHISSKDSHERDNENDLESTSTVAIDIASGCQFMMKQIRLNKTAVSHLDKSIPPDFSTYSKLVMPVF